MATTTPPALSFQDLVDFYRDEAKRRTGRKPTVKEARRSVLLAQAHGFAPHTPDTKTEGKR
jgi:hypothetical protein